MLTRVISRTALPPPKKIIMFQSRLEEEARRNATMVDDRAATQNERPVSSGVAEKRRVSAPPKPRSPDVIGDVVYRNIRDVRSEKTRLGDSIELLHSWVLPAQGDWECALFRERMFFFCARRSSAHRYWPVGKNISSKGTPARRRSETCLSSRLYHYFWKAVGLSA